MRLGVLVDMRCDVEEGFRGVRGLGLGCCQLCGWDDAQYGRETAERVEALSRQYGVSISAFWCGWPGPQVWNFYEGPLTLGLVPKVYRMPRLQALKKGSDFAKMLGVTQLATHAGFIPESPADPDYPGLLAVLRELLAHCRGNDQKLLFETGQETPVTLLRLIEDLGGKDVGINFDPANLLMYGKANPIDALDILGGYVMDVHAKDGEYPINGRELGVEKPLGEGRVNFPLLIAKLKAIGYDGPVIIEREIAGKEQARDILKALDILRPLI